MFNIFVFTSKGSVLIKCEPESTIAWLLDHCTKRMQPRGLDAPFVEARQEDGMRLDDHEQLKVVFDDHPVRK